MHARRAAFLAPREPLAIYLSQSTCHDSSVPTFGLSNGIGSGAPSPVEARVTSRVSLTDTACPSETLTRMTFRMAEVAQGMTGRLPMSSYGVGSRLMGSLFERRSRIMACGHLGGCSSVIATAGSFLFLKGSNVFLVAKCSFTSSANLYLPTFKIVCVRPDHPASLARVFVFDLLNIHISLATCCMRTSTIAHAQRECFPHVCCARDSPQGGNVLRGCCNSSARAYPRRRGRRARR